MGRIERAMEEAVRLRHPFPAGDASRQQLPSAGHEAERAAFCSDNPLLVTCNDPAGPVAEEYRKLKSMIISLTKRDAFRNTLMVTSALSGEGKSITAINLAVMLAQEYNHTVLLIDADLRMPSLHQYLSIDPGGGLADILTGSLDVKDALVQTSIPKLSFVSSGTAVNNPAELLSSHAMRDLLRELKHRYRDRYIVIDTPPVLPFAETHAVGHLVDGVVFVVKEGIASMKSIREALDILPDAMLLGLVYNDVSQDNLHSRYHAYYYSPYRRQPASE